MTVQSPSTLEGWRRERFPDGTVRLTPASPLRPNAGAGAGAAICLLLGFVGYLLWLVARFGSLSSIPPSLLLPSLVLPALGVGLALHFAVHWMGLGQTHLHVGPGFLEVRRQWPGQPGEPARRRYEVGSRLVLELERIATGKAAGAYVTAARLTAQSVAGVTTLDETVAHREPAQERLEALGTFLSEQTGWPLTDHRPENRKWL